MTEKNNEQTVMYSQLQPWSTVGSPPCVEPVSGPTVAPRVGTYYQVISTNDSIQTYDE